MELKSLLEPVSYFPRSAYFSSIDGLVGSVTLQAMHSMPSTGSVRFTTKGQVVIPNWLRKQFSIEAGTRCIVEATEDGILLKPVTAGLIRLGRGILKPKPGASGATPASERARHRKSERDLEDRHAR